LSLTLRDAQHLCWKTYKKLQVKEEKRSTISTTASDLKKKAGEIAEKMKTLENSAGNGAGKEDLAKLLSELLYLAFILAEHYGVSLEESFMQTIDEYILGLVN
jgi:NTP pyrophosphatase (non-canonical NTP hydrolase)